MIVGQFHQGSGLGNQLHRYVATRVRAADLGVGWDMVYHADDSGKEEGFKGQSFMDIGWHRKGTMHEVTRFYRDDRPSTEMNIWEEKRVNDEISGVDVRSYDPEFNFIEDNTVIEGEFQSEVYWQHREREVDEWLKVKPLEIPDDLCVIGFRGGEFALYPDLFLTKEYWDEAVEFMYEINPNMRFEVHTDDKALAQKFFPEYKVIHDIGLNWRSMRYAKYAIIANSSFFILPRWLRDGVTVAPRFWGRRNTKVWSLPQNYYSRFQYL